MKTFFVHIALILCLPCLADAQLPSTDLYMLDMKINEVALVLENPKYLSSFNRGGYNNQPSFTNDHTLLITSDWNAEGLTDIYRLDLNAGEISRVTATLESEYSPLQSVDGQFIFTVRQELTEEEQIPQILWRYPTDQSGYGDAVIKELENIGYYHIISDTEVALFLVGPPHKLVIYDLGLRKEQFIAYNVGRTFKLNGKGGMYYVQNIGNTKAVRLFDLENKLSRLVTYLPERTEDFEVLPNGDLVTGNGATLYRYDIGGTDTEWKPVLDLSSTGVNNITRIAANRDKLVFVNRK